MDRIIRKPTEKDSSRITHLLERAFAPSMTEAELVRTLRSSEKISFDYVADENGTVVAYVCYSAAYDDQNRMIGYHLAPLAVYPEKQRQGIGFQIVRESLALIGNKQPIYVLGDPEYYIRFGFRVDKTQKCSFDPEGRNFMVLFKGPLSPRKVLYEKEFMQS